MLFLIKVELGLIEIILSAFIMLTFIALYVLLTDILGKLSRKVTNNSCNLS